MKRYLCLIIAFCALLVSLESVSNDRSDLHLKLEFLQSEFPAPVPGGPLLYTNTGDKYEFENDILNKSEFMIDSGKDIEDKLLLTKAPFINSSDHTISFRIIESGYKDYFDKITMLSVDHPCEYSIAVTSNNDIAIYKANSIISPEFAVLSGVDVTSELAYDSSFDKTVRGNEKSLLDAEYDASKNSEGGDSIALIFDPVPVQSYTTNIRNIAGYVDAIDEDGNTSAPDIKFADRQKWSVTFVPLFAKKNISKIRMKLKHELVLSFAGTVRLRYNGFTEYELPLTTAENSISGNVTKSLLYADKNYAEVDSSSFLTLKFKNSLSEIPEGCIRDYVISVNGHYINPGRESDNRRLDNLFDSNPKSLSNFYLYQNYPNPFNPFTSISYLLIENVFVSLKVYNILGEEVTTLINANQNAGIHTVEFNGTSFPCGIYYYKLKSGNLVQTGKMVLLK